MLRKILVLFLLVLFPMLLFSFPVDKTQLEVTIDKNGLAEIGVRLSVLNVEKEDDFSFLIDKTFTDEKNFWNKREVFISNIRAENGNLSEEENFYILTFPLNEEGRTEISFSYDVEPDTFTSKEDTLHVPLISMNNRTLENVSVEIRFPSPILGGSTYFFVKGKNSSVHEYKGEISENGINAKYFFPDIVNGESLSFAFKEKKGYFHSDRRKTDLSLILPITELCLSLLLFLLTSFLTSNLKEEKSEFRKSGKIPPCSPYEAELLSSGFPVVENTLTSLILYWAVKGYVEIERSGAELYVRKIGKDVKKDEEGEIYEALFNGRTELKGEKKLLEAEDVLKLKAVVMKRGFELKKPSLYLSRETKRVRIFILSFIFLLVFVSPFFASGRHLGSSLTLLSFSSLFVLVISYLVFSYKYHKNNATFEVGDRIRLILIPVFSTLVFGSFFVYSFGVFNNRLWASISSEFIIATLLYMSYQVFAINRMGEDSRMKKNEATAFSYYMSDMKAEDAENRIKDDSLYFYKGLSYALIFNKEKLWMSAFRFLPYHKGPESIKGVMLEDYEGYFHLALALKRKIADSGLTGFEYKRGIT